MTNSTDVAIIGGGIMGASIAYHLAKLGVKSTIFERESIGCEASGVATGMISAMSIDSPGPYLELARASFEKYKTLIPEMEEASGVHTYYGEISWLDLAFTEEDEAANRANMEWRQKSHAEGILGDGRRPLPNRPPHNTRSQERALP